MSRPRSAWRALAACIGTAFHERARLRPGRGLFRPRRGCFGAPHGLGQRRPPQSRWDPPRSSRGPALRMEHERRRPLHREACRPPRRSSLPDRRRVQRARQSSRPARVRRHGRSAPSSTGPPRSTEPSRSTLIATATPAVKPARPPPTATSRTSHASGCSPTIPSGPGPPARARGGTTRETATKSPPSIAPAPTSSSTSAGAPGSPSFLPAATTTSASRRARPGSSAGASSSEAPVTGAAASTGGGSDFGLYDPYVNAQFSHDIETDRTTLTLVYPLDMRGAMELYGPPLQPIDDLVNNHTSVAEGVADLIDGAEGRNVGILTGCCHQLAAPLGGGGT